MAYWIARDRIVLFGGFVSFGNPPRRGYLNDTWTWGGSTWTRKHPATSPPPGYGFAMAYDVARHNVVLFGGTNDSMISGQTWIWDGTNWTQQHPSTSPPPAYGSAAVYDPNLSRVVMLAGDYSNPGATWSWDGANWIREDDRGPSARVLMAGAFDESNGTFLIFGGSQGCGEVTCTLGDTWSWDGSQWTEQSPPNSPVKRSAPAAGYYPIVGHVVLFGGYDFAFYNDTWTWGGTDWTQQHPSTSPMERASSSIVYDDSLGRVLRFGGWTFAKRQVLLAQRPVGMGWYELDEARVSTPV